jgi:hypothetical protein
VVGKEQVGFSLLVLHLVVKSMSVVSCRYDIECLLRDKSIHKDTIHTAICRSLRGQAGAVVMRLGPEASIEELLHKREDLVA